MAGARGETDSLLYRRSGHGLSNRLRHALTTVSKSSQACNNASMSEEPKEATFTTVAKVGEIPAGEGRAYPVNGTMVAVFFVDGEYSAINDFCPHMGASLAEGHVEDGAVMCPWHAWSFSIEDGSWLDSKDSPIRCAAYQVRVVGKEVQVSVPPAAAASPPASE